jgi:thiol-disulfide isomerase/thioredoxin
MTDRQRSARLSVFASAVLFVVAACSSAGIGVEKSGSPAGSPPASTADTVPAGSPAPTSEQTTSPSAAPNGTADTATPILDQDWATAELVDVATGETFRIADHAGKVIFLETMAIWCPTCRSQQNDVRSGFGKLPADSVVHVVLDIDPSEKAGSLADYRKSNSFTGIYAIAGAKVARALAKEFGDQILNAPSTPIVIVGTDGRVTLTEFGRKSPADIVSLAKANGA